MSQPHSPALQQLISDRMASGHYASEEDLLLTALLALTEEDEELRAIEAGLASLDQNEPGVGLDEAFDRLQAKYGL